MRTLPAPVVTALASGAFEAISILRVYWSNTPTLYADKAYPAYNVKGVILSISQISDIRDLNKNILDISFTVELDDTNEELKNLIATRDITNVRVELLQWFSQISFSDAFKLFEGNIASPMTYSSGSKSLTFTVLNKLTDNEFGFSAEEGQFEYLPSNLIGKSWPGVFGQVASVPLLQIAEPPSAITGEGFGVVNQTAWASELNQLRAQLLQAQQNQQAAFFLGLQEAYRATQFDDPFNFGTFGVTNDPTQAKSHKEASKAAFAQAAQYALDVQNISAQLTAQLALKAEQESFERDSIPLIGLNVPSGITIRFKLNDLLLIGTVSGNTFNMISKEIVINFNTTKQIVLETNTVTLGTLTTQQVGQKFYWVDGGTKISVLDFTLSFVIATTPVTVATIKAKQHGIYVKVPTEYYTIEYPAYVSETTGITFHPTILRLNQPLTSYNDPQLGISWDSDQVYADVTSDISSNVIDILIYIIENYTTLDYDITSFAHVRTLVDNFRANFVLLERKNSIQLMREIAYQARCSIWTNDQKFYIRYLPEKLTPIDTITLNDIESNSLELFHDTTENLITKYVATWKASLDAPEPFKLIYRYNIQNYGLHEEDHDFYIYNNLPAVQKSAEYWIIKEGNSWKRIRFNVSLEKLALETFDPITIDFQAPWIVEGTVTGIIESSELDTEANKISLVVWLPVRAGENAEYIFATPKDVVEVYPKVGDTQIRTGNPLQGVEGQLVNKNRILGTSGQGNNYETSGSDFFNESAGRGEIIADSASLSIATPISPEEFRYRFGGGRSFIDPVTINRGRPLGLLNYNSGKRYDVKPYVGVEAQTAQSATYPGIVVDYFSAGIYNVNVYLKGLRNDPTLLRVQQIPYDTSEIDLIGPGSYAAVYKITGSKPGEAAYMMFVPVWAAEFEV